MAELQELQKNATDIYPVTLEDVVFDTDGNSISTKYQTKTDDALNTTNKTVIGAINEVNTELAEVKQSVSNGKSLIASAITDKGIETLSDATFQTMADNIRLIQTSNNVPPWAEVYDIWVSGRSLSAQGMYTSAVANGKIYIMGGNSNTNYQSNECYDPLTNTWTTKASMRYGRSDLVTEVVDNQMYAIGGNGAGYDDCNECYNPLTDTWTDKSSMITARYALASCVIDNKIYCIGGFNSSEALSMIEVYDTSTDAWTTITYLLTPRRYATASAVDNNIYVIGGYYGNNALNLNECYSLSALSWKTKTPMPTVRYGSTSEMIDNKIYVFGGISTDGNSDINEIYISQLIIIKNIGK